MPCFSYGKDGMRPRGGKFGGTLEARLLIIVWEISVSHFSLTH